MTAPLPHASTDLDTTATLPGGLAGSVTSVSPYETTMPGPGIEPGWDCSQGILRASSAERNDARQSAGRRTQPHARAAKRTVVGTEADTLVSSALRGAEARSRVPESLPSYVGADRQRDAGVALGGGCLHRRVRPNKRLSGVRGGAPRAARSAASLGKNTNRVSPESIAVAASRPAETASQQVQRLRDSLRAVARQRIAKCARVRINGVVEVVRHAGGHVGMRGLMFCGSVWECPACGFRIRAKRAEEVKKAVEWHGRDRAYLLTLTVRHGLGDDLKSIRSGVSTAWRKVQSGASWNRLTDRIDLRGTIRSLEITHGSNGFHPHLHIVLLAGKMDEATLEAIRVAISTRWQAAVERTLGVAHVPNDRVGCDLRRCSTSEYITKLGLELSSGFTKLGHEGQRTPLQVAADWVRERRAADLAVWLAFCRGMKGARMLTWSRGLKAAAGLDEKSDEELVVEDSLDACGDVLAAIPGAIWDRIRDVAGATVVLIAAAETGGQVGVDACVEALLHARPPGRAQASRST